MLKMKVLIVIDMQNDFIDGSLGTKEATQILPKVVQKVRSFDGEVLFTLDTHTEDYPETQEGKLLPVKHCIKGTNGWLLAKDLEAFRAEQNKKVFEKPSFGSLELAAALQEMNQNEPIESIELVGLCTDICVVSNALLIKAALPELPIFVDSSCCAGVTPEKHDAALETMRSCQIQVM